MSSERIGGALNPGERSNGEEGKKGGGGRRREGKRKGGKKTKEKKEEKKKGSEISLRQQRCIVPVVGSSRLGGCWWAIRYSK